MTPHFRVPDLLNRYRRVRKDMRRAVLAFWSTQTIAGVLLLALAAGNIALFLTATPQIPARAAVASFTENFSTTTYRDAVNTTGTWLGNNEAYLGTGGASSTRLYLENAPTGNVGFSAVSCKDASTCYLTTNTDAGLTILRTVDAGTSWEQVYSGDLSTADLNGNAQLDDIYAVPGTDVVYAVGKYLNAGHFARVLKSIDGGTTWAYKETGFSGTVYLKSISCSDANTCVVVGDNLSTTPRLYYTTNGGTSWAAGTLPAGVAALRGVNFINDGVSSTWRAVGTGGKVISSKATSTPGGWTNEPSGSIEDLRGVAMPSYGNVIVVGGTTYTTSFMASSTNDGGTYATSTHALVKFLFDVACGDANTCWAVGYLGIERSNDGGANWTAVAPNPKYLLSIAPVSASVAYVAGTGNYPYPFGSETQSWTLMKTSTSSDFTDININPFCGTVSYPGSCSSTYPILSMWQDPSDGQTVYAAGYDATKVLKSTDAGNTWAFTPATLPQALYAIDCATTQICFGGASFGTLYKTINGAATWSTQTNTGVYQANTGGVDAVTTQMVWVVGSGGTDGKRVARTEDGGSTYTNATGNIPSIFGVYDVWAANTSTAWVAGYNSSNNHVNIYYTSDSGASWTQQYDAVYGNIGLFRDLYFLPGNNIGWAVGGGQVVKTTNAGGTWTQVAILDTNSVDTYGQIWFLNENVGFITGTNFLTTVDGGIHWTKRVLPNMNGAMSFYQNEGVVGAADNGGGRFAQLGRIVFAFNTSSVLQSTTIDSVSEDISCANITPTDSAGGIVYEMSNDGGSTWTAAGGECQGIDAYEFVFASTGSDLRWRATLSTGDVTQTPLITNVEVNYLTNTVPATPTNSSPSNNATNQQRTPTLTTSAFSDPDPGDTHASSRWEVTSVYENFSSPTYASTSTINLESITVPSATLLNNTTYYWHVKYVDANGGNSAFSSSTAFTTNIGIPDTPTNALPANTATNVLLAPTLSASAFSDPDTGDTHASSRWEVSTSAINFASPVFATTSTLNLESITIPSGTLANNTTYYWHVKYVDNNGDNGAFSTVTSFTTLAASGGSSASTILKSSPPTSPTALPKTTTRNVTTITWRFQDTASNESGFSIVNTKDQSKVYASTNPIFTQNISELTEKGLSPATEHCDRAVIAFNDKGNSPITASSIYPCTWTLPAPPAALEVTSSTPTTITLGGIEKDANPATVLYEICELTTKLCLTPGSVSTNVAFAATAADTTYVLSEKGARLTKEQWGDVITIVGLAPETTYSFLATAFTPNGDSASGQNEKGQTAAVQGTTTQASVKFSIAKEVAINASQAALAGITFAADFSFAALALMALTGMAWFLSLHRKSGSVRCVLGLCRIFRHHTSSYAAVVGNSTRGPALSRHERVHRFTQGALIAALGALALKGTLVGIALLAPIGAFGQGDFSGDGLPVKAGDVLTYQIILKNIGPSDATFVVMTDAIPSTLSYQPNSLTVDGIKQSDVCDNDASCFSQNTVVLKRQTALKVGDATIVSFSTKVSGKVGEMVINTACITSNELSTPTCAAKTVNPIGVAKIVNTNQNLNTNKNTNVPLATNVNRRPVNGNVNQPTTNANANQNINVNENTNVNAPVEEPPTPPTEEQKTFIQINEKAASLDLVVTDATPEVSGTGEPGSLVALRVDGVLVGVTIVEADGTWSFTLRDALSEGTHTITASLDGVVFDTAQFGVDTVAPAAVGDLNITITKVDFAVSISAMLTGQTTGDREATIQVSGRTSADTSLVRIRVESDPIEITFVPPSTSWTRDITARFDAGEHTVTAFAYDAAGNVSASASKTFVISEPEALETPLALLDDPQVEAVATISAPILPAIAALNVALATGLPTLFNFLGLLLTQPSLLFARKEKKGYGTIFNALSKLPIDLAIVRVRDQNTNRILQTKVTDRLGRYVFFLNPGAFAVEVTKQGYVHPSQYLSGKTEDVAYTDLFAASSLSLSANTRLAKNIPLDPLESQKTPAAIQRTLIFRKLQYAFALSGPVLSLVTFIVTPTLLAGALLILQILFFTLFRRLAYKKPPKSFGIVTDAATGKPLKNAVIRIFETIYNKLLETQVTDARGRYAFLVGQSRYYVTAQAAGYATTTTAPIDFTSVEKGGLVARDITLGQGTDVAPSVPTVPVMPT